MDMLTHMTSKVSLSWGAVVHTGEDGNPVQGVEPVQPLLSEEAPVRQARIAQLLQRYEARQRGSTEEEAVVDDTLNQGLGVEVCPSGNCFRIT